MKYEIKTGDPGTKQKQVYLGNIIWPPYIDHDTVIKKHWSSIYAEFLDFQISADVEDTIVGVTNTVPLHWDRDLNNLPAGGFDWAIEKGVQDYKDGLTPNVLVALQVLINPDMQGRGLSYEFLEIMKQVARANDIRTIAIPVRPTYKHLYPLIPMEEYLKWTNPKGEPFDAWIRVHIKAGGKIVSICSESMDIRGSVADWQEWVGLQFQSSGQYVVDRALRPIDIDMDKDVGVYIEPNVWILHST